jgi:hypothetical protein
MSSFNLFGAQVRSKSCLVFSEVQCRRLIVGYARKFSGQKPVVAVNPQLHPSTSAVPIASS